MNYERIKELASEVDRVKDFYEVGPVQRAAIEYFAQKIIEECARIADDGLGSAHFGLGISGQMLKDHFGIDTQTK